MKKIARSASLRIFDPGQGVLGFLFGIPFARDHGGPETEPFQFLGEYRHGQFGGIMKGADNEDGMRLFFRCVEEAAAEKEEGEKQKVFFHVIVSSGHPFFLEGFFFFPPSDPTSDFSVAMGSGPRVSSAWHGALS